MHTEVFVQREVTVPLFQISLIGSYLKKLLPPEAIIETELGHGVLRVHVAMPYYDPREHVFKSFNAYREYFPGSDIKTFCLRMEADLVRNKYACCN